jgi:TP901 family phage tail tape measure protein
MASVATLIPQQTANIMQYREEIKNLSIETGKSFDDLTRGLYETISAFPGTEDAIGITELAAKTARAGLSTTKEALSLLSATTKAYGDTSLQAQKKVADLAFTAVKLGQTTFPEMASAIQKVTERSSALGVSQEELYSVFGTFTGVTGDAEMAATQMRSALIAISNPTQELQQVFTALGVIWIKCC